MSKPTTHQHINFPCEACKNWDINANEWEWIEVCPESLQLPRPECPAWKMWVFKSPDKPTVLCEMHQPDANGDGELEKCPIPYHQTGKLLIWTGQTLSQLAMKETAEWRDVDRPGYLNSLVATGANAERFVSWVAPGDPWDPMTYYDLGSDEYWDVVLSRLSEYKKRDLTAVLTVTPYHAGLTRDCIDEIIARTRFMLPNIVYECANEPSTNEEQEVVLRRLQAAGIPLSNVMVAFVESSDWYEMMKTLADVRPGPDGEDEIVPGSLRCLLSHHQFGSPETVQEVFIPGGNAEKILSWGNFVGSCDGPDKVLAARGMNFKYLQENNVDARRPDLDQLRFLTDYFIRNGAGFEMLSAASYQRPTVNGLSWPNMEDAIILGGPERQTMSTAWMPGR